MNTFLTFGAALVVILALLSAMSGVEAQQAIRAVYLLVGAAEVDSSNPLPIEFAEIPEVNVAQIAGQVPLPESTDSASLQLSAVANGNGSPLQAEGYTSIAIKADCTTCSGGTLINFERTHDGTTWTTWPMQLETAPYTVATSTSTTGTTYWRGAVGNYVQFRARISAYSAGTVTAAARGSFAPFEIDYAKLDPCKTEAQVTDTVSVTTDTVLVPAAAARRTYICSYKVNANAAEIVSIWEGTGSACGTSSAVLDGSLTEANGNSLAANGGWVMTGTSGPAISGETAAVDTCLRLSSTGRVVMTYNWVQR